MNGLEKNEFRKTTHDQCGVFIRTVLPSKVLCVDELQYIEIKYNGCAAARWRILLLQNCHDRLQ
jgi:hypothetical protein